MRPPHCYATLTMLLEQALTDTQSFYIGLRRVTRFFDVIAFLYVFLAYRFSQQPIYTSPAKPPRLASPRDIWCSSFFFDFEIAARLDAAPHGAISRYFSLQPPAMMQYDILIERLLSATLLPLPMTSRRGHLATPPPDEYAALHY